MPHGAMPEHIKKNLLYRKVWNDIHALNLNTTFIFIGKPGMGKSVTAQKIAYDLDPTFNINRIVFSIEEFLKLLSKGDPNTGRLKPGQAIIFDEIVTDEGAESRGAMSKSNKLMTYIAANFRARRLIVFFCLPSLMQLDKNLREVNVSAIINVMAKNPELRKNKCKVFFCRYDPYTQMAVREYPRIINEQGRIFKVKSFLMPIPKREIIEEYESKKMLFLQKNIERWHAMVDKENQKQKLVVSEVIKEIRENPEPFMENGKFHAAFIKINKNLGVKVSQEISHFLNNELEQNKFGKALPKHLKTQET